MLAYGLTAGALALRRHWNLESQALDMGYADQITWNMTQGRLYRFTPFRGIVGSELGRPLQYGPGADRDSLFAYHVELLYLPLSLLYLIHSGPETLIVFLTAVLALGAVPTYLIAQHLLRQRAAALAFAAVYLLFPAIQAANLSDFHLVSASPTFLLWTLYFLLTRRYRLFVLGAVLSALLKEEVGLLVAAMGAYLWLTRQNTREARLGLAVAAGATAWVALCFLVIIPHFTGGATSLFLARYGDAIGHLRRWPADLASGRLDWPLPAFTVRYVLELAGSTGFLALLAPIELALAAPVLAVNGLSGSTWQHGGGAHYSAEVVPGLLFAAIVAVRRLGGLAWRFFKAPPGAVAIVLSGVALAAALFQAREHGILPPAKRFHWPALNGRLERLQPLLTRIPPGARVSAQSNVYPHLSNREWIYVFPNIEDARYVLVDVAGTSDPLYPDELFPEVSALLASGRYSLLQATDGFLLFERPEQPAQGPQARPNIGAPASPPASFLSFTQPSAEDRAPLPERPLAQFEDLFDVIAFRAIPVPEVNFAIRRAIPTVYLRARRGTEAAYRLTTFRLGPDNLARIHDDGNPTQIWRPSYRWEPGDVLSLRYPPLTYARGERLGIGAQRGVEADAFRLRITGGTVPLADNNHVAVLGPLP